MGDKSSLSRMEYLEHNLDGFADLNPRSKRFAALILFSRNNRHSIYKNAYSFNRAWLSSKTVGADNRRFERVNSKLGLFWTNGSFSVGEYSKPWWLTEKARDVIVGFAMQCDPKDLMQNTSTSEIPLDLDAVKEYMMDSGTGMEEITECSLLIAAAEDGQLLNIEYNQLPCGRKVAIGSYTIQHMPKWLRNIALSGWYDIDFRNCHYTIASTYGDFPTINEYVENTEQIREMLAMDCGVSKDSVKKAMLSKIYGAKNSTSEYCAVGEYLGKAAESFINHWFIKSLDGDIKRLVPILLEEAEKNPWILGKDASKCAQVLMHDESRMLDIATSNVDDAILMFDGFMTQEKQDIQKIQSSIRKLTGIPIEVTEGRVG